VELVMFEQLQILMCELTALVPSNIATRITPAIAIMVLAQICLSSSHKDWAGDILKRFLAFSQANSPETNTTKVIAIKNTRIQFQSSWWGCLYFSKYK
jgi:hypothetical protein